jgi:hypothetical protein
MDDPPSQTPAKPAQAVSEPLPNDLDAVLIELDATPYVAPMPQEPKKPALRPLSAALESASERLQQLRAELKANTDVPQLVRRYEAAFLAFRRVEAFALSERLAQLEAHAHHSSMPPCFRIKNYTSADLNQQQRFDLWAHDLQWIAAKWPEQAAKAHGSYKRMLGDDPAKWIPVAEFHWARNQAGIRHGNIAHIVNRMALSEAQQWECLALQGKLVRDLARGLKRRKATVQKALDERLKKAAKAVRGKYKPHDAYARRFKVWVCAEMTTCDTMKKPSPTKAANLYRAWTGIELDRRIAHEDLEWMAGHIRDVRAAGRKRVSKEPSKEGGNRGAER